jgi:hypothetical protein
LAVIKVRLQADGRLALLGKHARYSGTVDAARTIFKQEGAMAFSNGMYANILRGVVVNAFGMATYDQSKRIVCDFLGEDESLVARFLAALFAGVGTAVAGCPCDVIKTRMMNQFSAASSASMEASSTAGAEAAATAAAAAAAVSTGSTSAVSKTMGLMNVHTRPLYSGVVDCCMSLVKKEGVVALWKGLLPVYMRQAPFNLFNYLIIDQLMMLTLGKGM